MRSQCFSLILFIEFSIRFSVSAENPATRRGLCLLFLEINSKISLFLIKLIVFKLTFSFLILFLLLSAGLKSATAAAHTAKSTGSNFLTSLNISSAEVIFLTSIPFGEIRLEGPAIRVVFIPSLFNAIAIS